MLHLFCTSHTKMGFYQDDKSSKDNQNGDTGNDEAFEDAVSKKLHANVAKRNSNKFSPKLEEIQEENKMRSKKNSAEFDIPPSLDSVIVTRSVSSHSQSNDDDYNDGSDHDTDDHPSSDDDSEFLSKDDMKMFGNKNKTAAIEDNDIVSDIYSTAFSKVPKVSADNDSIIRIIQIILIILIMTKLLALNNLCNNVGTSK